MTWPVPSIDTIYQRIKADMESRVTQGVKIPRVSFLGVMSYVFAGAVHLTYGFLDFVAKQIFVDTASDIGRERWANILGLPRKAASYTTGVVSFTGTAAYTVVAGTEFSNSDGYTYTTDDDFIIGTTANVAATATDAGTLYNSDDVTMSLVEPDPDVDTTVVVVSGFDDGVDLETIESWVLRLLQRFQNPPSSGNAGDYVRWALEVAGVGRAWCLPLYAGEGTVGVVVTDANLQALPAQIVTNVADYIDTVKPIPAEVTVLSGNPVPVDFQIALDPNESSLQTQINEELTNLFLLESGPGYTVLLSHIRAAISAAGPHDYEIIDIEVDSISIGVIDVETSVPDIAVFNSASYSAM